MRNSRAEKYLLLRSLVRTVAATRVSVQIRELKIARPKGDLSTGPTDQWEVKPNLWESRARIKNSSKNLVVSQKTLIFAAKNLEYYDYGNIGTR